MTRNPVGWFEIYVTDMARARAFYEATLACSLQALAPPGEDLEMWSFPMVESADAPGASGALVWMKGAPSGGAATVVYFSCDDCAVEGARVAGAGGSVFKEKFSIGPYGFIVLARDTEGNLFGLHSMR